MREKFKERKKSHVECCDDGILRGIIGILDCRVSGNRFGYSG